MAVENKTITQQVKGFLPPTSVEEIVRKKMKDSGIVDLVKAPLHVAKLPVDEHTTSYVAVIDKPLSQFAFIHFLNSASPSPYKYYDYMTRAVIADWQMPDNLNSEDRRLNHVHAEGLGQSWQEFERHRRLFLEVLKTEDKLPAPVTKGKVLSVSDVAGDFMFQGVKMGGKELLTLLSSDEQLMQGFGEFFRATDIRGYNKKDPASALRAFAKTGQKRRAKLLRHFLQHSSPEMQDRMLQQYAQVAFNSFVEPKEQGAKRFFTRKVQQGREETLDANAGNCTLRYPNFSIEGKPTLVRGRMGYQLIPESVRYRSFVKPLLHWQTSTDPETTEMQRKWVMDLPNDEKVAESTWHFVDKNTIEGNPVDLKRLNPLVGIVTIPYFSFEVRNKWPRSVGLPNGRYEQSMGPAQIPVLAHIRRNDLFNEDIISAIEDYANQ